METTRFLLNSLERADEIMVNISKDKDFDKLPERQIKVYDVLHGIISKCNYDLEKVIEDYEIRTY